MRRASFLLLVALLTTIPVWSPGQAPVPVPAPAPAPAPTPAPAPVAPAASVTGMFWPNPNYTPGSGLGMFALDASASLSDKPIRWKVKGPELPLTVSTPAGDKPGNSLGMAYPSQPGKYTFKVVAVATVNGQADADAAEWSYTVLTPGSPTPTPTPAPPTPSPASTDTFGLTAFTRSTLAALPWTADVKRPGATTIGAIFTAQAANAASYPTAQAMSDATAQSMKAALGPAAFASWSIGLIKPLATQWAVLNGQGKLLTTPDLAEAYLESAQALKELQ